VCNHPRVQHAKPKIPARYRPRGLEILHEDRDILVVNKEPGLLTVSYRRDETRTAEHILTNYLRKGNPRSSFAARVVHRLDRETSGLLVFAKSAQVQARLKNNWKQTEKIYLAIVHGHLASKTGIFSSTLTEDEDQFVHSVDDPGAGRLAETKYQVIKETRATSVVKVTLLTGRKNQIRVHFAENGHPVVGDPKYGRPDSARGRMALHAKFLAFPHPHRGERIAFDTGIPEYFQRLAGGLDEAEWSGTVAIPPS
jgi:tRNA pseudouridine32 synthase/23S rRNA pseudouridine746 synthase/23S rRNA pseudouridine1911/1915/1917 synthase